MEWLPRRALFGLFLLECAPTFIEAFHCSPIQTNPRTKNIPRTFTLSMGLYEENIDWDADLFGQIGKSNDEQSAGDEAKGNPTVDADALDDSNWAMEDTNISSVKSMRKQMNQSWGKDDNKKEEGKPTAEWMGIKGPDEDEPWFTG